jgi:hypothetical protein
MGDEGDEVLVRSLWKPRTPACLAFSGDSLSEASPAEQQLNFGAKLLYLARITARLALPVCSTKPVPAIAIVFLYRGNNPP